VLERSGKTPQLTTALDPASKSMLKESQCDAQGNFSFAQLPDGAWFILTQVRWMVGYALQGGILMRQVSVANGETIQVLLTEKDWVAP
jgi:hypothetical protein